MQDQSQQQNIEQKLTDLQISQGVDSRHAISDSVGHEQQQHHQNDAADDDNQIDDAIKQALLGKDRETVLAFEVQLISFIQSEDTFFEFPDSLSTFQRMLAHRVAQYYGLSTKSKEFQANKTPGCVIALKQIPDVKFLPKVRVADVAMQQQYNPQTTKVLQRPRTNNSRSSDGNEQQQKFAVEVKTVQQVQEEYQLARDRLGISENQSGPDGESSTSGKQQSESNSQNKQTNNRQRSSKAGKAIFRDKQREKLDPDYRRGVDSRYPQRFGQQYDEHWQPRVYMLPQYSPDMASGSQRGPHGFMMGPGAQAMAPHPMVPSPQFTGMAPMPMYSMYAMPPGATCMPMPGQPMSYPRGMAFRSQFANQEGASPYGYMAPVGPDGHMVPFVVPRMYPYPYAQHAPTMPHQFHMMGRAAPMPGQHVVGSHTGSAAAPGPPTRDGSVRSGGKDGPVRSGSGSTMSGAGQQKGSEGAGDDNSGKREQGKAVGGQHNSSNLNGKHGKQEGRGHGSPWVPHTQHNNSNKNGQTMEQPHEIDHDCVPSVAPEQVPGGRVDSTPPSPPPMAASQAIPHDQARTAKYSQPSHGHNRGQPKGPKGSGQLPNKPNLGGPMNNNQYAGGKQDVSGPATPQPAMQSRGHGVGPLPKPPPIDGGMYRRGSDGVPDGMTNGSHEHGGRGGGKKAGDAGAYRGGYNALGQGGQMPRSGAPHSSDNNMHNSGPSAVPHVNVQHNRGRMHPHAAPKNQPPPARQAVPTSAPSYSQHTNTPPSNPTQMPPQQASSHPYPGPHPGPPASGPSYNPMGDPDTQQQHYPTHSGMMQRPIGVTSTPASHLPPQSLPPMPQYTNPQANNPGQVHTMLPVNAVNQMLTMQHMNAFPLWTLQNMQNFPVPPMGAPGAAPAMMSALPMAPQVEGHVSNPGVQPSISDSAQ